MTKPMAKRTKIGIIGCGWIADKMAITLQGTPQAEAYAIASRDINKAKSLAEQYNFQKAYGSYEELLADDNVELVYIATPHSHHYEHARMALLAGKHVLCETPFVLDGRQAEELYDLAKVHQVVLMEANKTAHCPAVNHLMVMIKSGVIGTVVDIEASLSKLLPDKSLREFDPAQAGGSMFELGSYPLLPIIKLLGTDFRHVSFYSLMENGVDIYTKGFMHYPKAVCSFKLGLGVKTEGNLIISGTKGYAYVEAPWWKTDFFELRYEDQNKNKKFFYKWDGEGLRYEIQEWMSCIINKRPSSSRLLPKESIAMARVMQQFTERTNMMEI